MNKKHAKNITRAILLALGAGLALYFVLSSPSGARRLLKGIKKEWRARRAREALDRLQRRKLVSYRQIEKNVYEIELTDAGKRKVLYYKIEEMTPRRPKRWDDTWRIILFDIPESKKKARDALRQKFHVWGFYMLQKSVFVYPFPCEDEIAIIRDLFEIPTSSLILIETKHVAHEKELKRRFGLR